jgi:hypothetical protein
MEVEPDAIVPSSISYIDALLSRYSGANLAARLEFAARALLTVDPQASLRAFELAVTERKSGRNVTAYMMTATELTSLRHDNNSAVDKTWIDATNAKNAAEWTVCEANANAPNVGREVSRSAFLESARLAILVGQDVIANQYLGRARDMGISARQAADTTLAFLDFFLARRDWQSVERNLSSRPEMMTEMSLQK